MGTIQCKQKSCTESYAKTAHHVPTPSSLLRLRTRLQLSNSHIACPAYNQSKSRPLVKKLRTRPCSQPFSQHSSPQPAARHHRKPMFKLVAPMSVIASEDPSSPDSELIVPPASRLSHASRRRQRCSRWRGRISKNGIPSWCWFR
jgi:hypothetical protein